MIWWDLWRKSHAINWIIDRSSICSFLIGWWMFESPGFKTPAGRLSEESRVWPTVIKKKAEVFVFMGLCQTAIACVIQSCHGLFTVLAVFCQKSDKCLWNICHIVTNVNHRGGGRLMNKPTCWIMDVISVNRAISFPSLCAVANALFLISSLSRYPQALSIRGHSAEWRWCVPELGGACRVSVLNHKNREYNRV